MLVPFPTPALDVTAARFTQPRLRDRLAVLLGDLQQRQGCSLPQACGRWANTQAAYRFLAHPQTTVDNLLPAFALPAVRQACHWDWAIVVHDSTSFNFSHLRRARGLGFLNDSPKAKGLHLHSSLLLSPAGTLLGLVHLNFWVREQFRAQTAEQVRSLPIADKESFKWIQGLRATGRAVAAAGPARPRLVHVLDREGDIHEVFAEVKRLGQDAVIRCSQDRRVDAGLPDGGISYSKRQVAGQPSWGRLQLRVPLRENGYRMATVEVRAAEVRLRPDVKKHKGRRPLRLWLVEVREVSVPPAGESAVQWWLWTTLRCQALDEVLEVLRIYRVRWRVEDYHRALKTSCGVEKLRLQSGEKLMKAIALQAWVATRVVQLRDQVKQMPGAECTECFSAEEWQALWARQHQRPWQPGEGVPTVQEVVKWLGRLGGHQGRKCDGLPGAEVLSRGLYALTLLLEGRAIGRAEAANPRGQEPVPVTDKGKVRPRARPPASYQLPHV